jgi:two-component system CitB family response regulator
MGDLVGVSRSTARRYLEFLLESEKLSADQSYGSIGRPERCYKIIK